MTKKTLNQNDKYVQELIDIIEPNFIFSNDAIDRFQNIKGDNDKIYEDKSDQLEKLKKKLVQLKIVI